MKMSEVEPESTSLIFMLKFLLIWSAANRDDDFHVI